MLSCMDTTFSWQSKRNQSGWKEYILQQHRYRKWLVVLLWPYLVFIITWNMEEIVKAVIFRSKTILLLSSCMAPIFCCFAIFSMPSIWMTTKSIAPLKTTKRTCKNITTVCTWNKLSFHGFSDLSVSFSWFSQCYDILCFFAPRFISDESSFLLLEDGSYSKVKSFSSE